MPNYNYGTTTTGVSQIRGWGDVSHDVLRVQLRGALNETISGKWKNSFGHVRNNYGYFVRQMVTQVPLQSHRPHYLSVHGSRD